MPPSPADAASLTATERDDYRQAGFIVCREVFSPAEMAEFEQECARLMTARADLIDPLNLRCRFMEHADTGEKLFEVFDPVNDISPVCERFSQDARVLAIVESLLGESPALFKEKLIFKLPGARGYNLHQDIPRYWAGFPRTFLTVLIPIDRLTDENGCTEVFSGYHDDFMSPPERPDLYMLPEDSVDLRRQVKLTLQPGDLAVFHGLTPHRSAPNRSPQMRRAFYVSYNAYSDGGDQRAQHYREFHERMRQRLVSQAPDGPVPYFR
jgi:hypothetical protein